MSLSEIIYLPRELIVQGDYDLACFTLTLRTEKKWTRALGSQSLFIKKGGSLKLFEDLQVKINGTELEVVS